MKLVPLGDRVVLKQLVQKRQPNPVSSFPARTKKNPSRLRSLQ